MTSKFVPTEELAKHFAITPQTVRLWVRQGKIPAGTFIKIGNTHRFDIDTVEAALLAQAGERPAPTKEPTDEVAIIVDEVEQQEDEPLLFDFDSDDDV